ncbi:cell wall protein [Venturia nashicola]|uniref:Cell wall protein n=1 Tax=Venturia nashicola TaxID=86259 RepID=A0A4Z1P0H8_9PEZI|nr:cell wall protein [Venturia nashicola]
MLYSTIASFALFGATFAAPVTKRDLQTIQASIQTVGTALTALDGSVKAIQVPGDAMKALGMSMMVNQALADATTKIIATQPITLTDALTLQQSAQTLTATASTAVTNLIAKKAIIQQAGASAATLQSLMQQKTAADALAKAVVAKVPANVQSIAQQQTAAIGTSLDKGIAAFK